MTYATSTGRCGTTRVGPTAPARPPTRGDGRSTASSRTWYAAVHCGVTRMICCRVRPGRFRSLELLAYGLLPGGLAATVAVPAPTWWQRLSRAGFTAFTLLLLQDTVGFLVAEVGRWMKRFSQHWPTLRVATWQGPSSPRCHGRSKLRLPGVLKSVKRDLHAVRWLLARGLLGVADAPQSTAAGDHPHATSFGAMSISPRRLHDAAALSAVCCVAPQWLNGIELARKRNVLEASPGTFVAILAGRRIIPAVLVTI